MELTLSCRLPLYWPTSPMTCATSPRSMPAMRGWSSAQNGAVESWPWRLPSVSVVNPPRGGVAVLDLQDEQRVLHALAYGQLLQIGEVRRSRTGLSRRLRLFRVGVRL